MKLYLPVPLRNLGLLDAVILVWSGAAIAGLLMLVAAVLLWPGDRADFWRRLSLQFEGNLFYTLGWGYVVFLIVNLLTAICWFLYLLVPWHEY